MLLGVDQLFSALTLHGCRILQVDLDCHNFACDSSRIIAYVAVVLRLYKFLWIILWILLFYLHLLRWLFTLYQWDVFRWNIRVGRQVGLITRLTLVLNTLQSRIVIENTILGQAHQKLIGFVACSASWSTLQIWRGVIINNILLIIWHVWCHVTKNFLTLKVFVIAFAGMTFNALSFLVSSVKSGPAWQGSIDI